MHRTDDNSGRRPWPSPWARRVHHQSLISGQIETPLLLCSSNMVASMGTTRMCFLPQHHRELSSGCHGQHAVHEHACRCAGCYANCYAPCTPWRRFRRPQRARRAILLPHQAYVLRVSTPAPLGPTSCGGRARRVRAKRRIDRRQGGLRGGERPQEWLSPALASALRSVSVVRLPYGEIWGTRVMY